MHITAAPSLSSADIAYTLIRQTLHVDCAHISTGIGGFVVIAYPVFTVATKLKLCVWVSEPYLLLLTSYAVKAKALFNYLALKERMQKCFNCW